MIPRILSADPHARPDYLAGIWDYARGRPADEHDKYADAVRAAEIGKWDPGWIRTWQDVEAALGGCWFDESIGARVAAFYERFLVHYKGPLSGEKFRLLDWQKYDLVYPMFGWMRGDGVRRFNRGSIWVPKKNGKTTWSSGLTIYLLGYSNESGAEIYSAATSRLQASRIHRDAAAMVKRSSIRHDFHCVNSTKEIFHPETDSFYRSLSADADSAEGLDAYALIFDEIHALKNESLWNSLYYSTIARKSPLFLSISTAGEDDPESVGRREWNYAKQVSEGRVVAPEYFSYIAAADPEDDIESPDVWRKANPGYGENINAEEMASACRRSLASDPQAIANFKRYRLNIWVQEVSAAIDIRRWEACGGAFDLEPLEGRRCFGGMDLGRTDDLTSFCLLFPPERDELDWRVLWWTFLPRDIERDRSMQHHVPYDHWAADGWVTMTEGNELDYNEVERVILDADDKYNIARIGYDRRFATQIVQNLSATGIDMLPVAQGHQTLSAPWMEVKRLINLGRLRHGDNPVMRWQAGNVVERLDDNLNAIPHKKRSIGKVDGISALCNAGACAFVEAGEVFIYSGM